MKKILCFFLLFFLSLSCFTTAQDKPRVKLKHIAGEVVAYDTTVKAMTVRGKKNEIFITLDEKTAIKVGKEAKGPADIKVGDLINVKYIEEGGKNLARHIEILR